MDVKKTKRREDSSSKWKSENYEHMATTGSENGVETPF